MAHHQNVPLGFRFHPTDKEIVGSFLHTLLVDRSPLMPPYSNFIRACNLFGNKLEPSEIWNKYGGPQLVDQDLYFLSGLKKLTPKRMDRSVGHGGTWSETESFKLIEDDNGNPNPIGRKRKFRYENKGSEEHTWWLLDEYSLFVGPKNDYNDRSYDFDFVICRMRKNDRASSKEINLKRSSQDQVQKKRSTNKKMKKDHEMGSPAESSSHVEQACSSSLTGGELVVSYDDVDPIDLTFFEDNPVFNIEQILGETKVEDACSPSNSENVDSSYLNWTESYMKELMACI
ncbi:NAC domain-containing protein 83-like [Prunus avium]|uniref:NAC domain-containing protein 83-like n=1 Tax=Prunus avium TaxID=42229 RepID=A0A6P5TSL8_PRUAV|nr:NAC domain-containing protein 83-like [Prunus avium]